MVFLILKKKNDIVLKQTKRTCTCKLLVEKNSKILTLKEVALRSFFALIFINTSNKKYLL